MNNLEAKVAHACKPLVPTAFYNIGVGRKTEAETMREVFPNIHLHGCEPHESIFKDLSTEGIWTTPNSTIHNVAIAKEPVLDFYESLDNDMRSSAVEGYSPNAKVRRVNVNAVTLDQFDDMAGNPDGIILWMDIEGYEFIALETGPKLLASRRVIAINLEERIPRGHKIQRMLSKYGYHMHLEYNHQFLDVDKISGHLDVIYRK